MRRTTTAALTAVLLALSGCSSGDTTTEAKPSASPKVVSPSPAVSESPVAPDKPLAFGSRHVWKDTVDGESLEGHTTVLGYEQPVRGVTFGTDGLGVTNPEWATIDVKVCTTKGSKVMVSQAPWSLGFPDDTRITPDVYGGPGLPRPQYPTDGAAVKVGDCIRGKIPVVLEKGTRPDRIIYEPAERAPVEWAVPKA